MNTTLCCAYLRMYQPLRAFDPVQRSAIEQAMARPTAPAVAGRQRPALSLIAPEERQEVFVKEADGTVLACPAQTRLRTLLGMMAFDRMMPDGTASLFFGEDQLTRARSELASLQATMPTLRPCMIQSPWHVPLRWFVAFDDSERRIEHLGHHPRVCYETSVRRASERVSSALEVLRGGIVHPGMSGMVFELGEWLSSFDDGSHLELDYASVSRLFSEDDLADDHSAADIAAAIQALAERDGMRAALYYQRAGERWSMARDRGALN